MHPLQCKCRILATGLPGKPLIQLLWRKFCQSDRVRWIDQTSSPSCHFNSRISSGRWFPLKILKPNVQVRLQCHWCSLIGAPYRRTSVRTKTNFTTLFWVTANGHPLRVQPESDIGSPGLHSTIPASPFPLATLWDPSRSRTLTITSEHFSGSFDLQFILVDLIIRLSQ